MNEEVRDYTQPARNIDLAKKEELQVKFAEAIANPRFWLKETRVKALEDAMAVPVFDDKSLQQFYNHAMDDLNIEAARKSNKEGVPAVLPTEDAGKRLAWERYLAQARKQIIKELKKEGKEVVEDAIKERLDSELDMLSDKKDV